MDQRPSSGAGGGARPTTGLSRVLDDLGTTLLELVHGRPDRAPDLGGVAFHDPLDPPLLPPGALVLGVGVTGPAEVARLLADLGRQGAAALVVRSPAPATPEVLAAAATSGVALLGLTRGATWAQLASMLRSLLAEGDVGAGGRESLGGLPSGDLFAVAGAVGALLDAPITIEDRHHRVLAFSGRQEEADAPRAETILGLQVPERFSKVLAERGVLRELHRSDRPVLVDPVPTGAGSATMPRVAIAVRAGGEVLGSIWAVAREPFDAQRTQALCEAAKLVALHLLRVRAGADVERRLRADLLRTAVDGGSGARDALARLHLVDRPVVVLALAIADPADRAGSGGGGGDEAADAVLVHERQRIADAFAVHLGAVHSRASSALLGDTAYGLLPVVREGADGEEAAVRTATDFLDRVGDRVRVVVGVGPVARDVAGLAHARVCADRVVRVLRGGHAQRVARLPDVQVAALVLELRDLAVARGDRHAGPVARLVEHDAEHGSQLVPTLRAWLEAFGDVRAASAGLFVHPNTFRYRLRRLAEVSGLDLADPEARFAALLQLRVVPVPPSR